MAKTTKFIIAALLALGLDLAGGTGAGASGITMYGNWCGPGERDYYLPPVDELDRQCMNHDICYDNYGYGSCGCDVAFMRTLRNMSYPHPALQERARAMYDALAMMPCDSPNGWAVKQSLMWNDIASDALNGRATPFDVPGRWLDMLSDTRPH